MSATLTRAVIAACAAAAMACNPGRDDAASTPPPTVTPGEAAATGGAPDQTIRISGCLISAQPDGYLLTSLDDAIVATTGTSGRHTDNTGSPPTDPNRRAEQERTRHELNVSAEAGRYRLTGDPDRLRMHVNREVEVMGRVQPAPQNEALTTLHVEAIDATGASCGADQRRGNDRGVLPTQDLPRKPRG